MPTASASAFLVSLFTARSPVSHTDKAEIMTDWEFVNDSDLSDEDIIAILSDSESEYESTIVSVSFVDTLDLEIDDQDYGSVAVVGIRSTYDDAAEERKKTSKYQQQLEEEDLDEKVEDPEFEFEFEDDVDDELVPWSVCDRFGRQRMRKLGTRAFAKMNKTTKKFAYSVDRSGCVRGKHGVGRKA